LSKFLVFFKDGSNCDLRHTDATEAEVLKQMKRPQHKRLYVYGIDFSTVKKIEVVS